MSNLSIDELRQPWESDEHWMLRKEFLENYQKDFDEDRLLCLAQVYTNIELMDCSYPDQVMRQVRELASGLSGSSNLKEARKKRAQVQFVKEKQNNSSNNKRSKCSNSDYAPVAMDSLNDATTNKPIATTNKPIATTNKPIATTNKAKSTFKGGIDALKGMAMSAYKSRVSNKLPLEALHNALQSRGFNVAYDVIAAPTNTPTTPCYQCKLLICDILVADVTDCNKKKARVKAAETAIEALMKPCQIVSTRDGTLSLDYLQKGIVNVNISCRKLPPKSQKNQKRGSERSRTNYSKVSELKVVSEAGEESIFSNFLIVDNSFLKGEKDSAVILHDSAVFCRIPINYDFRDEILADPPSMSCDVYLNSVLFGTGSGYSRKESKQAASEIALMKLRKQVYTVKVKSLTSEEMQVSRETLLSSDGPSFSLSENNIGHKMMKMMGWSGGGLGKNAGIVEPIKTESIHGFKGGLGFNAVNDDKKFYSKIESLLQNYVASNSPGDVVFTKEFTKEERKIVHKVALKYNLKNNSRGQGEDRFLIISRHYTANELLQYLKRVGGTTKKYQLIQPS